ncbi:tetratricopeptide repeat protein [Shewanella sp. SW36]|jgi:tetratricopeptide (TPR) repeat protein|uniref:tetratricopeptide repeat protein n=1 Tax=Shewanella TaxID=22 RepID=UPI0021D8674C|nr:MULTISPECIES: tetratricopeptide repeat protein [unclassified Shewanella]MCU7975752.1 tetratricopeptide repeat protein [Shewanella sp. SW36]MCU7991141.1 tetratricopeptide repeat protein [Shewanella sp. SW1]MCU8017834.1 tetratricopeptide repeat protein [Shewanella sp. SM72]MCU8052234.1 tetratricopeptide repeat protein [Shewanella sp. SM43]
MKTLLLASSFLLISTHSFAATPSNTNITNVDAASNAMNLTQLQQLSGSTQDYDKAYANYRLAISANVMGQKTLASSALTTAQTTLEALETSQANAESLALLSSVYGMQIALDNSKGATLGMKSAKAIASAEQLEPQNPRVALVKAIAAYNTPAIFGGSMQNAKTLATTAIERFAQPCDNICWGEAEAYTWRGLAKQELGDSQGAIEDWQQAIKVQADYGWAKFLLQQNQQLSAK